MNTKEIKIESALWWSTGRSFTVATRHLAQASCTWIHLDTAGCLTNSEEPDHSASRGIWSGPTWFAQAYLSKYVVYTCMVSWTLQYKLVFFYVMAPSTLWPLLHYVSCYVMIPSTSWFLLRYGCSYVIAPATLWLLLRLSIFYVMGPATLWLLLCPAKLCHLLDYDSYFVAPATIWLLPRYSS